MQNTKCFVHMKCQNANRKLQPTTENMKDYTAKKAVDKILRKTAYVCMCRYFAEW